MSSLLVHLQTDAVKLGEEDEVGANEVTEVATLHLAFFVVARVNLVSVSMKMVSTSTTQSWRVWIWRGRGMTQYGVSLPEFDPDEQVIPSLTT